MCTAKAGGSFVVLKYIRAPAEDIHLCVSFAIFMTSLHPVVCSLMNSLRVFFLTSWFSTCKWSKLDAASAKS